MVVIMSNEIIKGMGFHHISLKASNYNRSLKFYKSLGMKPVVEWGEIGKRICMLDVGDGSRIEIFESPNENFDENGRWNHFALCVQDVDKAYCTAISFGAVSISGPKIMNLDDAKPSRMTIYVAFVEGPDKEQIEFFKQVISKI